MLFLNLWIATDLGRAALLSATPSNSIDFLLLNRITFSKYIKRSMYTTCNQL